MCLYISGKPSTDPNHTDYVPSVFVFSNNENTKSQHKLERYERHSNQKRRRLDDEFSTCSENTKGVTSTEIGNVILENELDVQIYTAEPYIESTPVPNTQAQLPSLETILLVQEQEFKKVLQEQQTNFDNERKMYFQEMDSLRKERDDLKDELSKQQLTAETLSQEKVKFYTGLPNYGVFQLVLKLCESSVVKSKTNLTLSDELLLTLMKLRLNLTNDDLSFRFHVSKSSVSVIFHKWLYVLYVRLKPFVKCVPKEIVMATLPNSFKKDFKFCRGIFDCSEIYIEQPVRRKARAQTWSNYKRHNTVNFFINVTPRGLISFISKGYGGRISDKEITLQCGILNLVDPTDTYLADRGFQKEVQEAFAIKGAKVITPAFTHGKTQMSAKDVETSRKISNVRIHVERVIGLLKNKYQILKGPLPVIAVVRASDKDIATIDKILLICAALSNLSEGIVL